VVQCIAIPVKYFDQIIDNLSAPDDDVTITKVEESLLKREETTTDGTESASSGYTASGSSGYGSDMSSEQKRRPRKRYHESYAKEYAENAK